MPTVTDVHARLDTGDLLNFYVIAAAVREARGGDLFVSKTDILREALRLAVLQLNGGKPIARPA